MKLIIRNLDTSSLLYINFFDIRNKGFIPLLNAHKSDVYFDLYIKEVKGFNVGAVEEEVVYNIYPSNNDISPYTLKLPYGTEIVIFKEL